jgi:molybdopterin converting factor small subunit
LKVRVQYFGYIKNLMNKREEQFELGENASLSDLLNKMADVNGAAFRKDVYEPGLKDVKTGFCVTVNGVLMGQLGGVDTKLADGDNVILMSLMSGG